ncbi:MAG: hypothetical protein ABEH78_08000 [Haloferacaceae archaeon]
MRIRQRQLVYGTLFGAGAFVLGWALTYLFLSPNFLSETPTWQAALLLYINGHFVEITDATVGGIGVGTVDLITELPNLGHVRALPPLSLILASVLTAEAVGYSSRGRHILQNAASAAIGYVPAVAIGMVVSGARPGISLIVLLGVGLAISTYIGAGIVQKVTGGLPILAITSLGGLAAIGLLTILGGLVVLNAIWPLLAMIALSVIAGGVLMYAVRNAPT